MNHPFFSYAKRHAFLTLEDSMYSLEYAYLQKKENTIAVISPPIPLSLFDDLYVRDLQSLGFTFKKPSKKHTKLMSFILKEILGIKITISEMCFPPLSSSLSSLIIDRGKGFPFFPADSGSLEIHKTYYALSGKTLDLENIAKTYEKEVQIILQNSLEESITHYYNSKKRIGFQIIDDQFYATTQVEPFFLQENGKTYQFSKAILGTRLNYYKGNISWEKLKVINSYTHPGLPKVNRPLQTLCVGDFDYEKLKKTRNVARQIIDVLYTGRTLLTQGYLLSEGVWHPLHETIFAEQKL